MNLFSIRKLGMTCLLLLRLTPTNATGCFGRLCFGDRKKQEECRVKVVYKKKDREEGAMKTEQSTNQNVELKSLIQKPENTPEPEKSIEKGGSNKEVPPIPSGYVPYVEKVPPVAASKTPSNKIPKSSKKNE